MENPITLEICLESVDSVIAADLGGAQRIELCANLLEGGTTPSAGTIRAARENAKIAINVMIRPRGGDFLYTDLEFASMKHDIRMVKELGADGIVLGLLRANGTVDVERTQELVDLARPLPVTFHRAIDVSRDLLEALEDVISTGAARVLTSGGQPSVVDGGPMVARMVQAAKGRIIVMPGCGIRQDNVQSILAATGASEVHIALETEIPSAMQFRKAEIPMGGVEGREYVRFVTPEDAVRDVVRILNS
ncbi:copper homeostasis protein CutC [Alloacidobacterium dinghuense]|uniref:PF03932 family protein CutC n=1 Tax=Alloacidobacterium dinghuense TaxID=2763107 RepID=A0A7G8BCI4_9BACT|nr:copper homeostasis protein CutC [Alloacidobacterium dinghuense]QNI30254.1 copper homeostasis protein CutC [Alloacidobacterium dinghuense]